MLKDNSALYRALVLTILAGVATMVVAMSNRDVYSKEVVDTKIESVEQRITHMEDDVRWLVRRMGGTPSVETEDGDHTSQPHER